MFLMSPRNICLSLATNFVSRYKFPRWLNWATSREQVTCDNVVIDMSSVKQFYLAIKSTLLRLEAQRFASRLSRGAESESEIRIDV